MSQRIDEQAKVMARKTAELLEAARKRDGTRAPIFEIEIYCTNDRCNVRAVSFEIKEFDGPDTPAQFCCPACWLPAKVHHVYTAVESADRTEASARRSVNRQIYRRANGGTALIPGGVLFDDSLPGTPHQVH